MSVLCFTCIKKTHPCRVCGDEHLCLIIFLNFGIFAVQAASGHLLAAIIICFPLPVRFSNGMYVTVEQPAKATR